jgi:hypothetical protein
LWQRSQSNRPELQEKMAADEWLETCLHKADRMKRKGRPGIDPNDMPNLKKKCAALVLVIFCVTQRFVIP